MEKKDTFALSLVSEIRNEKGMPRKSATVPAAVSSTKGSGNMPLVHKHRGRRQKPE